MYKCTKCGKILEDAPRENVRCPVCANKIITKGRQPVTKTIKAR